MEFTSFKVQGIDYAGASPTRMARLVPTKPQHTWTPPAGRPVPGPQPRNAPSAGNARARRARRNGWNRAA